jgi:sulfatase maturation enzyme AslB (radical SAM superfamily)
MSNTWCAYPFLHLATFTNGDVTPCCIAKPYNKINLNNIDVEDAWNHDEVIKLRQAMLDGQKVTNCEQCYRDESHGIDSHRTSSNRYFEDTFGVTQSNYTSAVLDIENLITLDLRLGNTCNLKCIMCRPNESHKWFEDVIKLNDEDLTDIVKQDIQYKTKYNRDDYNWINKKVFWENIDKILPNIKEFIFGGGEPFMLKEVKHLLKRAVELDVAKNINIRFHTNGTYLNEKDFDVFSNFKKIQLMYSVDGVDQINYFLRYPADWNKIIENINISEKYDSNIETFILCSLNSVSAFYLDQLYDYVDAAGRKKLKVSNIILGRVYQPVYLNPQLLDAERKQIVKEKFDYLINKYPQAKDTLESNLNWIVSSAEHGSVEDTLNYIKNVLKIRNMDPSIIKEFLEIQR